MRDQLWRCEHGFPGGQGCGDCDPPLDGRMLGVVLIWLLLVVAAVVAWKLGTP